jgi:hypothetical protein
MAEIEIKNKRINNFIKKTVIETIQEILEDPDFGLELQEWVKKDLGKKQKN